MLTLCIPTKNRPAFVARLLSYYARQAWPHPILVGDSSDPARAAHTAQAVRAASGRLRVTHVPQPGRNVMECLETLGALAATPYCAWVSDDDFLCTGGLTRGLEFLEAHPEYVAAQGPGVIFEVAGSAVHGPVIQVRPYPHAVLNEASAAARLRSHLAQQLPSLHTAIRRTPAFRQMVGSFSRMRGARQGFIFDDIIPHCLAAMQGTVRMVDTLYLVRHAHEGIYRQLPAYDWITDPDWQPSYAVFRELTVEMLRRMDGLSAPEAEQVLKDAFWPYLAQQLSSGWRKASAARLPSEPASAAAERLKRIPWLRTAWRWARGQADRRRRPCSLAALLDRRSPYHAEFLPVYETVSQPGAWRPDAPAALAAPAVAEAVS